MSNAKKWFLKIHEEEGAKAPTSNILQVVKVAPSSPAAELGLEAGDLFVSINGKAALKANVVDVLLKSKEVDYVFYRTRQKKRLTVKTAALPLGFRTEATSAAIVKKYKKSNHVSGFDGIMSLWERGDYAHLRDVGKTLGRGGLLGKVASFVSKNPLASLIEAICEIETGDKSKGYVELDKFERDHMKFYTSDIFSLVQFYQALKLEKTDPDAFGTLMSSVMSSNQDSDRMVNLAEKHQISYVMNGQRVGSKYAFDWTLNALEGPTKQVSAATSISQLKPGQLLPVCFMVTYRGNGPYNEAMKIYHAMYPHVKDRLLPMFVMTSEHQKRPDRPHWFEAEEALIKAGVPIIVGYDPNTQFADIFLSSAPEFIALDHTGTVVWDFNLGDSYAYWDMLSRTQAA